MDTIEMKIAKTAANNWEQSEPKNLEEAKKITGKSEIEAVKGIVKILNLDPEFESKIIDEVYTKESLSDDIANTIKSAGISEKSIVEMLSVIHDGWVKNNPNNFMKEGRNKEYQFAPLMLLNWEEAKSDLLFLKPIIEAAGVEIDDKDLEEQFDMMQKEFLIENKIFSYKDLMQKLSEGSKFYPALEGLETKNGGNIEKLLQDEAIQGKMAGQINGWEVRIRSRADMALDIISSKNSKFNEMFWVKTVENDINGNSECTPNLDGPISKREIMLSKLIGRPYPEYFLSGVIDYKHDGYKNEISQPRDGQWNAVDMHKKMLSDKLKEEESEKKKLVRDGKRKYVFAGQVGFGYTADAEGPKKIEGNISLAKTTLLRAGLDPEKMGYEEREKIIKKELLSGEDQEIGVVHEIEDDTFDRGLIGVMTRSMYNIGKEYCAGFGRDHVLVEQGTGIIGKNSAEFFSEEECADKRYKHDKHLIESRKDKITSFKKKVDKSTIGKYDKEGYITIQTVSGEITIPVTLRELAGAGILPEDYKWKSKKKEKISSKDIAEADKEKELTTSEVGLFKRIIDKVKEKNNVKGE